jgi:hypothetical protein
MSVVRHAGVLVFLLGGAAAISWFLPITKSSLPIFMGAAVIFIGYVGISMRWAARKKSANDE